MFLVDYYQDESGKRPAEEFIDSHDARMREISRAKRMRDDWRTRNE